jgi:hypothetical protein
VGIDRTLPREEFLYRQLVSSADFLEAYHASAHGVDDYGFAPGYPAFCIGGGRSKSRYSALARYNENEHSSDMHS